jgi:hypothetical protein
MWFVDAEPANRAAAPLSVGFDGDDLVSVTVGRTWFEVFPVRSSQDVADLRPIIEAIFAGEVQEAGRSGRFFAIIGSGRSATNVGHVHLPLPRRARHWHRYAAYDAGQ